MKKGKLIASRVDMEFTINSYYEIYEINIEGQIFYINKMYKEVLTSDTEEIIREEPKNICNVYNHDNYLETLGVHFGFGGDSTIQWIEPLSEVEFDAEYYIKEEIDAMLGNISYELPSAGTALGGVKSGGDVTISNGVITVNDDSHNHVISNIDGLQSALDGKSATNHTHTAEAIVSMANALFGTNYQGGVEYSYGSGSGKNVLTEISNMPQGFHTIYAIAGTTGNPETSESYRYFIHKTSTTIGWFYAFGADGSIYSNYLAGANTFKGWKTIHDAKRKPLWSSARYMTEGHTVTPSKKLSECEHGWMLLWSDYDPDTATINDTDFCTTMIPNRNWAGSTWNGSSYYCDIPRYSAGTATDSESRIIKVLTVYDNKLVGSANNSAAPRNDVVLRAVYEF